MVDVIAAATAVETLQKRMEKLSDDAQALELQRFQILSRLPEGVTADFQRGPFGEIKPSIRFIGAQDPRFQARIAAQRQEDEARLQLLLRQTKQLNAIQADEELRRLSDERLIGAQEALFRRQGKLQTDLQIESEKALGPVKREEEVARAKALARAEQEVVAPIERTNLLVGLQQAIGQYQQQSINLTATERMALLRQRVAPIVQGALGRFPELKAQLVPVLQAALTPIEQDALFGAIGPTLFQGEALEKRQARRASRGGGPVESPKAGVPSSAAPSPGAPSERGGLFGAIERGLTQRGLERSTPGARTAATEVATQAASGLGLSEGAAETAVKEFFTGKQQSEEEALGRLQTRQRTAFANLNQAASTSAAAAATLGVEAPFRQGETQKVEGEGGSIVEVPQVEFNPRFRIEGDLEGVSIFRNEFAAGVEDLTPERQQELVHASLGPSQPEMGKTLKEAIKRFSGAVSADTLRLKPDAITIDDQGRIALRTSEEAPFLAKSLARTAGLGTAPPIERFLTLEGSRQFGWLVGASIAKPPNRPAIRFVSIAVDDPNQIDEQALSELQDETRDALSERFGAERVRKEFASLPKNVFLIRVR